MSFTIGNLTQTAIWDNYVCTYDWDVSGNMIYMGRAAIGTADKAAAVWQIIKFTYDGANMTDKQWADKGSFLNVWNTRATVPTYS